MAVPDPKITPVKTVGGTLTAEYRGPVVAVGSNQDLNVDLTYLPLYYRQSAYFRTQLKILFKSLDSDLSFAGPDVLSDSAFHGTDASPNEYVTIQVTSVDGTELCHVFVQLMSSVAR